MARKGYIYKGKKAVYWCPHCETALAEAEIEYKDRKSPSIYVKFPAKNIKGLGPEGVDQSKLFAVILDNHALDHSCQPVYFRQPEVHLCMGA